MFFSSRFRFSFLLSSLFITAACNRRAAPPPSKLAVLRFENLSPDGSADWMGRALSEVLGKEIGAASFTAIVNAQQPFSIHPVSAPGISGEKTAAMILGATGAITGYFTVGQGKLNVTATEEDLATGKTVKSVIVEGDFFSAADALAKAFAPSPKPFPTRNPTAVRLYAAGLEAPGPAAIGDFQQATAADPNFSDAYLGWTRAAAASGNRTELEHALDAAKARGSALPPLDRAYLNLEAAVLHQDANARLEALTAIVKLSPGVPSQLKALADAEVAARQAQAAIGHYQQALALSPDDVDMRNLLAYAQMFAGDYAGALASVREYQKLKPQDPNALDSEGDIHFYFGKFADAERLYLQSFTKNADFDAGVDAWKAARARLMTGDIPGASQLFQKFRDARQKAGDPSLGFRDAEWLHITGRRADGIQTMISAAQAASNPELRSLCYTQAAIWQLAAGQTAEASRTSTLALQTASAQTIVIAGIARFLAQPKRSPAEWRVAAAHDINGQGVEQVRNLAVAYADLLSHNFTAAAPEWKQIYERSGFTDQGPGFLYAWTLVETGQTAAAAPILKTNPIPPPVPAASFESFYFPSLFAWRGDAATFMKLGGTRAPAK